MAKKETQQHQHQQQSQELSVIEPTNGGAMAAYGGAYATELADFTGLESITQDTWIIPRIRIVQPTSREGTAGRLIMNLTGDEYDNLPIVVVKATQGRVLWDKKNPGNDEALCRSYDFLNPDTASIPVPPSPTCARRVVGARGKQSTKNVCPMAQWNGKEPPECSETFNLLCLLTDDLLPFWITLHGTSIQPVRRYLSAIALRRCPLWLYETVLSAEQTINDRGKFYVAKFSDTKPISKEDEARLGPVVAGLKDADIRRTVESEEDAMDEDDSSGGNGGGMGGEPMPEWMEA